MLGLKGPCYSCRWSSARITAFEASFARAECTERGAERNRPGKHPNAVPSVHSACDNLLVQAHVAVVGNGATTASALVQFMIGVVNSSGEARIAHIEDSVMASTRVTFGGPSVGSKPLEGPVPVCTMSRSFQPYGFPVAVRGIFIFCSCDAFLDPV